MPEPAPEPGADEVAAEISQGRQSEQTLRAALASAEARRTAATRSYVTRAVIGGYILALFATIGYLISRGTCCGEDVISPLTEILKTNFLPIVTLVIGYYFGQSGR